MEETLRVKSKLETKCSFLTTLAGKSNLLKGIVSQRRRVKLLERLLRGRTSQIANMKGRIESLHIRPETQILEARSRPINFF